MAILSSVRTLPKNGLQNVSAEPAVLLYSFTIFLFSTGMPNLIQQKVCSPESPPSADFICNNTALLAEATDIVTVRATLKQTLPAIVILLAGFWRDSTGLNKPIIYFGLFWEVVGIIIQMVSYLNWTISPWTTSIIEGIVNGLGGGSSLFLVGATCAIADNTRAEDMTRRFTFVYVEITLGACLATAVFGPLLTILGNVWFLILNIILQLGVAFLTLIFVKDKKKQENKGDVHIFLKQFKSVFKRGPNITVIWIMVFAASLVTITALGEANILQYYLQQTFDYTIDGAGLYIAYRLMVASAGAVILSFILTKYTSYSDFQIGIACCILSIVSCFAMVFAATRLEIILLAFLDIPRVLLFGIPRSIISKCAPEDEMGKFLSFCLIGECFIPIVIFYIYDYIYTSTSKTLPGAFFLTSAASFVTLLMLYSVSSYIYTPLEDCKEKRNTVPEELENCESASNPRNVQTSDFSIQ